MSVATIGSVLDYLLGPEWDQSVPAFLSWPPDAFAVAGWMLQESGAYVAVLSDWPPESLGRERWVNRVQEAATQWRQAAMAGDGDTRNAPPDRVAELWRAISAHRDRPVGKCGGERGLCVALLELVAIADEASAGAGMPGASTHGGPYADRFDAEVAIMLMGQLNDDRPSTLCKRVHPSKAIVLPKSRTPDNGITLRSLTHHLALVHACGVRPAWVAAPTSPARAAGGARAAAAQHSLNLLLIPWPKKIRPAQFRPAPPRVPVPSSTTRPKSRRPLAPPADDESNHRYFIFNPGEADADELAAHVERLCAAAADAVGHVDGIVFPEMALSPQTYVTIHDRVRDRINFMVAGLYEQPADGRRAENYAFISLRGYGRRGGAAGSDDDVWIHLQQRKHHRWFLDDRQICAYGLGSQLQSTKKWWEDTEVSAPRELHFVALSGWLSFTVLICEDLARVEPAGELVRAVGPNLVIALLQDGPQLANRWPARAAHPLADDPGCAVLTVTGLGMTELMRPPAGASPSRAIAMWRDREETVQIELPRDDDAVVLCLTNRYKKQWTADGRHDNELTGNIGLAGIHGVRAGAAAASTPVPAAAAGKGGKAAKPRAAGRKPRGTAKRRR